MTLVTVKLDGMMCGMCESHIKDAIRKKMPDAQKLTASHSKNEATFYLENDLPKAMILHELHECIDPLGYDVISVETQKGVALKKGLFGRH